MKPEIYVSTDIKTDGPCPGRNSMLSIGSFAFDADGKPVGGDCTFAANLGCIPGAVPDPSTMEWWASQPEAWAACRTNPLPASVVMDAYAVWLSTLPGKPVFVGYPAGFDFTFVSWYLYNFAGSCPFGFFALDIKSFAMAVLGIPFRQTTKKRMRMPKSWFGSVNPRNHVALDDAIEQAGLFVQILQASRRSCVAAGVGKMDGRFAEGIPGARSI